MLRVSFFHLVKQDLGWKKNFCEVFGSGFLSWVFSAAPGDGMTFPVNKVSIDRARLEGTNVVVWPPMEYTDFKSGRQVGRGVGNGGDHDDGEEEEEEEELRQYPVSRNRVRKGSEGYLVKEYTQKEREAILASAGHHYANREQDGDFMNELSQTESSGEEEVLGLIKQRITSKRAARAKKEKKK